MNRKLLNFFEFEILHKEKKQHFENIIKNTFPHPSYNIQYSGRDKI